MSRIKIINQDYAGVNHWLVQALRLPRPWLVAGAGHLADFPTHAEAIAHADQLARAIREVP